MNELTQLILPRASIDALITLAARAEPLTATERFALADAQDQLRNQDLAEAEQAANAGPEQLELFDGSAYDV